MYKGKTFLAIIPARGGSKRLPRKNILNLAGKPLIAWTIEAGLKSKYIDKVIVTSDDDEILNVSKRYGAQIIRRPSELATDTTTTFDAINHTIENSERYDYIILLQATSPLRNEDHVDEAIELMIPKRVEAVVSVCKMEHSPLWSNTLPKNGSMVDFLSEDVINKRSQELDTFYRLNGAIYICFTDRLIKEKRFLIKKNILSYKMEILDSIDIDEETDFLICCAIMEKIKC